MKAPTLTTRGTGFAVMRSTAPDPLPRLVELEAALVRFEGVRGVHLDRRRRTLHILYNGDPRTLRLLSRHACDFGRDVVVRTSARLDPAA